MGDVLVTYKIMPDGVDVDLDKMKEDISGKIGNIARIVSFDVQPIAFGLKALIMKVIVKDEGGITNKLENLLSSINNVQGVVAQEVTLI